MKLKSLFLIVLVCTVFTTACLDSNRDTSNSINPLNKNIEPFKSEFPENVPFNNEIFWHQRLCFPLIPTYSNESLLLESDIALYGTLKCVNPSVWSTADQNPPSPLSNLLLGIPDEDYLLDRDSIDFENGTVIEYNRVFSGGCFSDFIYTTAVFEVNDMVKGENTTEVTIVIHSGQVGTYISIDSYYPTIWDLEVGQQYLLYLKSYEGNIGNYNMENNTVLQIMNSGLFVVTE